MTFRRLAASLAVAAALVAAATFVCIAIDAHVSLTSQAMVYLLAVVCAAFLPRRSDSTFTALLGVSALNFFFVPPRHTFQIASTDYEIALASFLAVSVVVGGAAGRLRTLADDARRRERRARQLYALGESLAATDREVDLVRHGGVAVFEAMGESCCVLECVPDPSQSVAFTAPPEASLHVNTDAARWASDHRETIGPTTRNWPELHEWYVPVIGTDFVITVQLPASHDQITTEDRTHIETMARQLGAALQRVRLAASAREAELAVHSEAMRNALLASISHDLRTPLAVIVGAASTLSEQSDRLPVRERDGLLRSIVDEASQMSAAAESVLQMARLSSGEPALHRDWESIEELVGSVIARIRRRHPEARVRARVPPALPLVRIDGVLVAQVIVNLVENSLRHAPPESEVDIEASGAPTTIELAVRDHGPGFDPAEIAMLFTRSHHARNDSSRPSGARLGLAICKAVIDAHHGTIAASNRPGGGAQVTFTLPANDPQPLLVEAS